SPRPAEVIEAFCAFPEVAAVDARGTTRASVRLEGGLQCDLRVVERPAFPAALQYFTGSQAHNVRLRALARARGYKLNEYGLFRLGDGSTTGQVAPDEGEAGEAEAEAAAGERVPAPDEHHLYGHLGLPYIPPELREDRGEVEAALAGRLPRLIKLRDIRGDLHVHSNWSDGRHSIEEMHARAAELGYEYLAITDHSPSLVVAKGLTVERLRRQLEEIRELRQRLGPPYLLAGIEVDIRADGSLDLPDDVLAELDIVVASVHSRLTMDEAEMTRRIVRAIENPHVDIIGHATGRVLGRRDAYRIDAEAVLAAAARTGTLVEINASPERLDVPDVLARRACQLGARLVINSDAHATAALGGLLYGIKVARRAWLEPERVVNTWPLERLRAFLAKPKGERARTV
ncbi:MAG TPA: PHP domain-containing protein, partial [Bacillota bacterium]